MGRRALIRSNELPYHVFVRANNREEFHLRRSDVWKIMVEQCFALGVLFKARVHGLMLMPNHYHLLISVPDYDLGIVMGHFQSVVTKRINAFSGRTGRVFNSRYGWSLIDSEVYFSHALKYLYRNPVRAGLCDQVEEFEWSTLAGVLGRERRAFPIHLPFNWTTTGYCPIPLEPDSMLDWFNRPFSKEQDELIRKGLRRRKFKLPVPEDGQTYCGLEHFLA